MVKVLKQQASFTADGRRNFEVVEFPNLDEALEATGLRASEVVVADNGFLCYGSCRIWVVLPSPVEDSLETVSGRYNVVAITKRAETLLGTLFPDMPHKGNSYWFKSLNETVKQLQETGEVIVRHTEPKQSV